MVKPLIVAQKSKSICITGCGCKVFRVPGPVGPVGFQVVRRLLFVQDQKNSTSESSERCYLLENVCFACKRPTLNTEFLEKWRTKLPSHTSHGPRRSLGLVHGALWSSERPWPSDPRGEVIPPTLKLKAFWGGRVTYIHWVI